MELMRALCPAAPLPEPGDLAEARGRLTAVIAGECADGPALVQSASQADRSRLGAPRRRHERARRLVVAGMAAAGVIAAIAAGAALASQTGPGAAPGAPSGGASKASPGRTPKASPSASAKPRKTASSPSPRLSPSVAPPSTAPASGSGTQATGALSFTQQGGYITVMVRDSAADPNTYNAELRAHQLNVTFELVPASPSVVGTLVYSGGSDSDPIAPITAQGRCRLGNGPDVCPVGLRIPVGYRGSADFAFGRTARPGEHYASTGPVDAPGEAMHGLVWQYKTVAAVLAMLAQRHVTAPRIQAFLPPGQVMSASQVSKWLVWAANPWAPQQVMLQVEPKLPQDMGG